MNIATKTLTKKKFMAVLIPSIMMAVIICLNSCAHTMHHSTNQRMVYADRYIQRSVVKNIQIALRNSQRDSELYNRLFVSDGCKIVEESVTPIYSSYLWDWTESGSKQISDSLLGVQYFTAKFTCSDGAYAGNIMAAHFPEYCKEGLYKAEEWYVEIIQAGDKVVSYNYADHSERIQRILGTDEELPPSDVRLVEMVGISGLMFYISNEEFDGFIRADSMIGRERELMNPEYADFDFYNRFIKSEELEKYACDILEKQYNEISRYREYDQKRPSEPYEGRMGFRWLDYTKNIVDENNTGNPDLPINNIINCYEYFGLDPTIRYPGAEPWQIITASVAAVAVISASFFIVRRTDKKKTEHLA